MDDGISADRQLQLLSPDGQRLEKLRRLREEGIEPYPARVERTHTTSEALRALEEWEKDASEPAPRVAVAGRLMTERVMGGATFAHLADGAGRLQIYLRRDVLGRDAYEAFRQATDIGDFVAVQGEMFRTRTGEPTVNVRSAQLAAKSLHPLPDKWHGLTDVEARYRHRYVDLIVNDDTRRLFCLRAAIISALRQYLDAEGFLEVETPILQPIYGGAAARPFVTHHNQLDQDLFLRISFELYLKRLIVGGYERVYEIGRDFRNEGVSYKHNPEFTQIEFYEAYADYHDVMRRTETMIAHVAHTVLGTTRITYQGQEVDLAPPWIRRDLRQAIREETGINIEDHGDIESLHRAILDIGGRPEPKPTMGKLVDYLIEGYVEPRLIQPTFLMDYPVEISPLAKRVPGSEGWVERFEGFVAGMELCNAFTELNDPVEQYERFRAQRRDFEAGDEEAHQMDEDFLLALSYGMPPTGGFGMGIDRLVMLLTDRPSIREVLLFPHMRSLG
ncbi:MAG: lysine--tRNA ligase [Anaerolineae bacterium]|nr:lysine--tRNA ligase [Anaerolineae bacterium]